MGIFRKGIVAVTMACVALPAAPALASPAPPTVLAIFAHPDDEIVVAPALAAEARKGAQVRIIYATRGDAGPGVSGLPKGAQLAQARTAEAECASTALGLGAPIFLDFGDGTLADSARGSGTDDLDPRSAIAAFIAQSRPVRLFTWGPDGGYGHADHRMVSAFVTQIVQAMPATDRPHLLYPGIRNGTLPPLPELQSWATSAAELLDTPIAYEASDLARAKAAAMCHETQFDAASRTAIVPLFDQTIWQGAVHFRSALPLEIR